MAYHAIDVKRRLLLLYLRAACSCGEKCLYHMKVFKLHLGNDNGRIME